VPARRRVIRSTEEQRETIGRWCPNVHVILDWHGDDVGTVADLAIVPVDRTSPFAMGKPENRLMLLWRMGQCVVATRTPASERAMRVAGTEQALCDGPEDWDRTLRPLLADPEERADLARRGREQALRVGHRDRLLSAWDTVLDSLDVPA